MSARKSWLTIPKLSHFSIANIPFGIITSTSDDTPRVAIAIGDYVLGLQAFAAGGGFRGAANDNIDTSAFSSPTLNAFAALGKSVHRTVRGYLQDLFAADGAQAAILRDDPELQRTSLLPRHRVQLHLPMQIGDYTDFYGCKNHAYNVGILFRGPENALQPNYVHLPGAYHGRASSIRVSGTPVFRPTGQQLPEAHSGPPKQRQPILAPCHKLDIELELGMFLCKGNTQGHPIRINEALEHIFGFVLLNDWSARDIQAWEYVPLGPFNGKNFASTISPWIVLADALEPFRAESSDGIQAHLLEYLQEKSGRPTYDLKLKVDIQPADASNSTNILNSNAKHLTYSFPQMMAHHTIGGCPLRVGDLIGSGTISGVDPGTEGSLLECSHGGEKPIKLDGGAERVFLQDGDTVTITGTAGDETTGFVGFGECVGTILPAPKPS